MNRTALFALLTLVVFSLMIPEPALAGPGGFIAKAIYETFWGKVLLGVLIVVFLPLITWVYVRTKQAERRALKDLRFMAGYSPLFEWLKIRERAMDCFYHVHSAWSESKMSEARSWMTDWYWQNQQLIHLERWKREGLVNICVVNKIKRIRPLLFVHRNHGDEHTDSMLVVSVEAHMQDYLRELETGKVVEGSKRWKDVETIWSFTMEDNQWKVSNIEEGSTSLDYAALVKELPSIEDTVVGDLRA